jgi:hypothetical protein
MAVFAVVAIQSRSDSKRGEVAPPIALGVTPWFQERDRQLWAANPGLGG